MLVGICVSVDHLLSPVSACSCAVIIFLCFSFTELHGAFIKGIDYPLPYSSNIGPLCCPPFLFLFWHSAISHFCLIKIVYRSAFIEMPLHLLPWERSAFHVLIHMCLHTFFQSLLFCTALPLNPPHSTQPRPHVGTQSVSDCCRPERRLMKTLYGLMTFEHYLQGYK